jgi:hypothetical protein
VVWRWRWWWQGVSWRRRLELCIVCIRAQCREHSRHELKHWTSCPELHVLQFDSLSHTTTLQAATTQCAAIWPANNATLIAAFRAAKHAALEAAKHAALATAKHAALEAAKRAALETAKQATLIAALRAAKHAALRTAKHAALEAAKHATLFTALITAQRATHKATIHAAFDSTHSPTFWYPPDPFTYPFTHPFTLYICSAHSQSYRNDHICEDIHLQRHHRLLRGSVCRHSSELQCPLRCEKHHC